MARFAILRQKVIVAPNCGRDDDSSTLRKTAQRAPTGKTIQPNPIVFIALIEIHSSNVSYYLKFHDKSPNHDNGPTQDKSPIIFNLCFD